MAKCFSSIGRAALASLWDDVPVQRVIVVLIIIGYVTGWFGGAPAPALQQ
jgi:hypothetical protein